MKKIIFITAILLISILTVHSEGKRKIAVYPLSNPTGERWINNLGKSVTDTVVLSLTLMGRYNIENRKIFQLVLILITFQHLLFQKDLII